VKKKKDPIGSRLEKKGDLCPAGGKSGTWKTGHWDGANSGRGEETPYPGREGEKKRKDLGR